MFKITKKIQFQRREDKFKKAQKKFDKEWEKEEKRILANLKLEKLSKDKEIIKTDIISG